MDVTSVCFHSFPCWSSRRFHTKLWCCCCCCLQTFLRVVKPLIHVVCSERKRDAHDPKVWMVLHRFTYLNIGVNSPMTEPPCCIFQKEPAGRKSQIYFIFVCFLQCECFSNCVHVNSQKMSTYHETQPAPFVFVSAYAQRDVLHFERLRHKKGFRLRSPFHGGTLSACHFHSPQKKLYVSPAWRAQNLCNKWTKAQEVEGNRTREFER